MDNYLGVIAAPTTPDGFLVENTNPYLEQPDGTYLLPERYAPTYIPADYALETHQSDGDEYYCYRKDDGFLFLARQLYHLQPELSAWYPDFLLGK